jgi:hypothetical protein
MNWRAEPQPNEKQKYEWRAIIAWKVIFDVINELSFLQVIFKAVRYCSEKYIDNIFQFFKLDRLSIPIIDILGATKSSDMPIIFRVAKGGRVEGIVKNITCVSGRI